MNTPQLHHPGAMIIWNSDSFVQSTCKHKNK
jgi:hypothetical protein